MKDDDKEEEGSFIAYLITKGRKSGKEHRVPLRLVRYNGRLYASRRDMNSDWMKNILHDPHVIVEMIDGSRLEGIARLVDDESLCRIVSMLKYKDDVRASMKRAVIEIEVEGDSKE
ncbi:MAG: nitroreductase/quinone reductase family protein [Candidatus Nitrosocaldus sp.]